MTTLAYYAISTQQYEQLLQLLDQFNLDTSKQKKIYEVQCRAFDLAPFERPSNSSIYCVNRHILKTLKNPWLAEQVIKKSFGAKTVEIVPKMETRL